MAKPKTIAKLVDDAAILLQKLVKLKAADENGYCKCVTCGKVEHWKLMDGGHFISRRWTALKLMEENIQPQCKGCNGFLNGNMVAYTTYMIDTYGREFVDELQVLKHETKKHTRSEVLELIAELKAQIKELE